MALRGLPVFRGSPMYLPWLDPLSGADIATPPVEAKEDTPESLLGLSLARACQRRAERLSEVRRERPDQLLLLMLAELSC